MSSNYLTEEAALRKELDNLIKVALIDEFNVGFDAAFTIVISGLEASLAKAKGMPEAKSHLDGLESSIHVCKGIRDEFIKRRLANS